MPKKIGRNSLCPCGSGIKYKKCCLLKRNQAAQEALNRKYAVEKAKVLFDKEKRQIAALEQIGIYSFFPKPMPFQDGYIWAIGNSIYRIEPGYNYTFHQFIRAVFLDLLGRDWEALQLNLPEDERHFIAQCYLEDNKCKKKIATDYDAPYKRLTVIPSGWGFSILNLAFDVCSLFQTGHLDSEFIRKLKDKNKFQGVRYEIAIASILARLGCQIEYLDRTVKDKSKKRCEFIISHKETGFKVAIEAKSRHRKGIIHMDGQSNPSDLLKGDVSSQIKEALSQGPKDVPFYIFIDINSPPTPDVPLENKPWVEDIKKIIEDNYEKYSDLNPQWHGIFITNFSYHYQKDSPVKPNEYCIFFNPFIYEKIKNGKFFNILINALDHYGIIPDYDEHGLIIGKEKIYEQ